MVALLALAVVLFSIMPFGRLVIAALAPGWVFNPDAAIAEITSNTAMLATWRSLETSLLSALLALVVGAMMALGLVLTNIPGRRMLALLFVLSMMIAPQVAALGFLTMAGPSSPILNTIGLAPAPGTPNIMMSREGIIFVLGLHHSPLVYITLRAGLRDIPRDVLEAARMAGARPVKLVIGVLLPLLKPFLIAGGSLAFVAAIGNFGIPALLGMPVNYLTLPTLIYRRLSSFGPSIISDAAALSVVVALLASAGLAAAALGMRARAAKFARGRAVDGIFPLGRWRVPATLLLWGIVVVGLVLPLLSLGAAAFVPTYGVGLSLSTFTLDNFVEVLFRQDVTVRAFRNSFLLSAAAAIILAVLAVPFAHTLDRNLGPRRRLVEAVLEVPYALPGVVLAIACILLFLRPLPIVGISIYGTPFIILFAYLARFLPMALKAPCAAVAQLPADQEEAARICGAGYWRRMRTIVIPATLPAAAAGALIVFLTAFNELTVSALLWSSGLETLGVALFSLEEAGFISAASAIALSAVAVVAIAMLVLELFARKLPVGVLPWRV